MEIFYHRLSNLLWGGIVLLLVVLAVYVSLGRLVTANLGAYQTAILQELNVRIPFNVEAERVSGEWHSFTPVIVLTGLRISVPDGPEAPLELTEGRVGLDVWNSLRTGSLQVTRLILDDLTLRGELGADGRFRLLGFGGGAGETDTWAREFLRNAEQVVLRRNLLRLGLPGGEVRELDLDLSLTRRGSRRSLEAKLGSTRGTDIAVLARGLGDPFEPGLFEGDLYLQVRTADLGAVKAMFAGGAPPVWAEGRVDAEFWLTWDRGVPSVEGRVEAGDLLVTPTGGGWQLPMQRVAFAASVARDREHWTLYASDVEVETDATALQLPRVQIDAWGRALRLRASEVALAPAASIAANLEALPESLREVIVALAPRGELSALQFSLGDFQRPADDWEVEANFEGLAVDSWRGAPGARSARGHVQLGAGGGEVIVDSEGLQLEFPGVYREPLHFDELHGTLHLDWDSSAVNLKSRLITAHGEEGRARALFALAIPLEPTATGIEMSLLVGLRDSHPTYRVKYVPYVLNQGLRDWLAASIGDGDIEEGAFLWRGSLKGSAGPLRTVQLAFNVTDTWLEYHEDWPGVTVEEGIVLIDDSRVSVWADRARVIDSAVENLSVETWLDSESRVALAVRGGISGPAADGLAVLNDSPLTDIVGGAFTDWSLEGGLETELALHLKLGDNPPPPVVDIDTRWRDVDLRIMPGNLPVESLNGEFSYSSENGFTSRALAGVLWGRTVNARLEQRHAGAAYDPSSSTVEVQVATDVAMSDVRDWLGLAPLGFASGEATASVGVRVAPGEAPVLTVASAVKEVALDLPDPWRKAPGTPADFRLEMPLGDAGAPMRLSLDDQLQLDLLLAGGELAGGSLGVRVEPTAVRDGVFHISGHAGLLQADQWLDFVAQYLGGGDLLSPPGGGAAADTAPDGDVSQVTGGGPPLNIVIERLFARELVFMDRNFGEGEVSLALDAAGWGLSVDADWLQGEMYVAADTAVPSRVEVAMLDLAGLPESAPGGEAPPEEPAQEPAPAPGWALPPLDVTLAQIVDGERSLGAVSFTLSGDGPLLNADNIRGELARVRLQESSPGQLTWQRGVGEYTSLKGRFAFDDIGEVLEYFGYERIVETRDGAVAMDLKWPGSPADFTLLTGGGSLEADMGAGSFLSAPSGAAGALRVVSILNLVDIVQRLSLSHMFESGIPFDSVTGEVYFHEGTIEVPQLDIEGGSSFRFSGVSDVGNESLSGELVATLPVAKNLPWVAALAASLPVAAGVFVVSKIFDKQMNRLSSAVYRIDGSWDDPVVSFDRIFDDTSQPVLTRPGEATAPAGEEPAQAADPVTGEGEVDLPGASDAPPAPAGDGPQPEPSEVSASSLR